jgi:hypothetical protein
MRNENEIVSEITSTIARIRNKGKDWDLGNEMRNSGKTSTWMIIPEGRFLNAYRVDPARCIMHQTPLMDLQSVWIKHKNTRNTRHKSTEDISF